MVSWQVGHSQSLIAVCSPFLAWFSKYKSSVSTEKTKHLSLKQVPLRWFMDQFYLPHWHSGNIYTFSLGSNSDKVRSEIEHLR